MSSMNFSTSKQFVRPPQRGIFPLDHDAECRKAMQSYLSCLQDSQDVHHKCRDLSKDYLQCRMDNQLMSKENLDEMGYGERQQVKGAHEYDKAKEKKGFVAGKHIQETGRSKWFFETKTSWYGGDNSSGSDAGEK